MASGDDPVIGKLGRVTHPIRPGHPGEVVLHIRGGTEIYMAVADTELPSLAGVTSVASTTMSSMLP